VNASEIPLLDASQAAQEKRDWLASDSCATPVLDMLGELGWAVVETPEANVHCMSPDGRAYVGWLPENPAAWQRGIVWTVRVLPAGSAPWVQEFGPDTPSEAVAGFLATLNTHHTC